MGIDFKAARWIWMILAVGLLACQPQELPTRMPAADLPEEAVAENAAPATVPPTWTPAALAAEATATTGATAMPPATNTPVPTATMLLATATEEPTATSTPEPSPTATAEPPTATATSTPVPVPPSPTTPPPAVQPTSPPAPEYGVNLLPNPSFEEGHYNSGGVAELQVPNGWIFEWDGGTNPFVAPPDDYYVRPETRVLPSYQLPPHEQAAFIWDGQYTVKIFKGYWAINVQLVTDLHLEPGSYLFEASVFPDMVVGYDGGTKVYAPDPYSGEVRFVVSGAGTDWFPPAFGRKNTFTHGFTITQAQTVRVGVGLRNRYGIMNNGWFIDNWSLRRVEN